MNFTLSRVIGAFGTTITTRKASAETIAVRFIVGIALDALELRRARLVIASGSQPNATASQAPIGRLEIAFERVISTVYPNFINPAHFERVADTQVVLQTYDQLRVGAAVDFQSRQVTLKESETFFLRVQATSDPVATQPPIWQFIDEVVVALDFFTGDDRAPDPGPKPVIDFESVRTR